MQAPLFTLNHLTKDGHYKLEVGKIIILTFWVSWCPDCSADLPKKEQLYQSINHDKVSMLTINVPDRERNAYDGVRYAEKFLTQPTLVDRGREIYNAYQCRSVPTTVIIDKDGYIHQQFDDQADFFEIIRVVGTLID